MKKLTILSIFIITASAGTALAQPGAAPAPAPRGGYAPAPPPAPTYPAFNRRGLAIGFGFGIGAMEAESGPIGCFDCVGDPVTAGVDFHIGGMLNPRLALLFEFWGVGQSLDEAGSAILFQSMAFAAMQYWVTPRLWIKGGIGVSQLSIEEEDGFGGNISGIIDDGMAVMGAIGYELMSTRRFALDLQARFGVASYPEIDDQFSAATIGVGFNWY